MKIARSILYCILAVLLVVCASHTVMSYVDLLGKPHNSAPASVALLLLLPYGISIVACVVAITVINIKIGKNKNK